ncbi:hypothetical protein JCM8097_000193 [Rhodosporidiobolus ruineniae]
MSSDYTAVPTHARTLSKEELEVELIQPPPLPVPAPSTPLRHFALFAAGALLLVLLATAGSASTSRAVVSSALERFGTTTANAFTQAEVELAGQVWRKTPEEEELQRYRWKAEPDESLRRALAMLSQEELRLRNWLVSTRPHSLRGTPLFYASPLASVDTINAGSAALSRASLPAPDEGPGNFGGGDYEKYGELLEEWKTGRPVLHDERGKWQEAYKQLQAEIIRGDRPPNILEYWCRDGF